MKKSTPAVGFQGDDTSKIQEIYSYCLQENKKLGENYHTQNQKLMETVIELGTKFNNEIDEGMKDLIAR